MKRKTHSEDKAGINISLEERHWWAWYLRRHLDRHQGNNGFQMVANAAKHGSYGLAFFTYGIAILNGFYPGYVFTSNYLAGGSASRYPPGTLVAGVFSDQFVDAANGDYTVRSGSPLKGAAPDGTDIGVNSAERARHLPESMAICRRPRGRRRQSTFFSKRRRIILTGYGEGYKFVG